MICVSLRAKDTDEALKQMGLVEKKAQLVELRLDTMEKWDLEALLREKRIPVVVTLRGREEGGGFQGDDLTRVAILKEAMKFGADFIDIDLRGTKRLMGELKNQRRLSKESTKFIVSYHNFSFTPKLPALKRIAKKCWDAGGDMVKVVTKALTVDDNLATMQLVSWGKSRGIPTISFCMGELGKASRLMAPLLGAPFTYASLFRGMEQAPGQLPLEELTTILNILRGFHDEKR